MQDGEREDKAIQSTSVQATSGTSSQPALSSPMVATASPASLAAEAKPEQDEGLDDALAQEDDKEGERSPRKSRFTNAKELIEELARRARGANERLRAQLLGSILIHLPELNQRFVFDWTSDQVKTETVTSGSVAQTQSVSASSETSATPLAPSTSVKGVYDCLIQLSEENLLRIASGQLNPQIGMLSHKIKVEGKSSLAIYFFNLIAPRVTQ